jgi:hypothetical protein
MKAYSRWQDGKFFEVEREFAKDWRAQLRAADLSQVAALARELLLIRSEPKNLTWAQAQDPSNMTMARQLSPRRGKWRVMPPEVEKARQRTK